MSAAPAPSALPPLPAPAATALARRRLLVLGAGWLGLPFAERAARAGAQVVTVRRSAHPAVSGGDTRAWDLRDEALPADVPPADAVILTVAPTRSRGDDHTGTYPAAARFAVRVAQACGARALCYTSSTGVYGYVDGRRVDEDTPLTAQGVSGEALREAERLVLAAPPPLLAGVLRVAGLYGPGRDPRARFRDVAALAGRAAHVANFAWRDDVGDALAWWLAHALGAMDAGDAREGGEAPLANAAPSPATSRAVPAVLNVADGAPLTLAECAFVVAQAEGRAAEPIPDAPDGAAVPPSRSNQRIDVSRLRALGWTPQVPHLRDGLVALGVVSADRRAAPYGPATARIRRFLQRWAGLDAASRARIGAAWAAARATPAVRRADGRLGALIAEAGREAERDAACAPLLQLLRVAPGDEPSSDAEAALATVLALVVADLLDADAFAALTGPVAAELPLDA